MQRLSIALIVLFCLCLVLVGCSEGEQLDDQKYSTTDYTEDNILESSLVYYTVLVDGVGQSVVEGGTAIEPIIENKTGYIFDGWFVEDQPFLFSETITQDISVFSSYSLVQYSVVFIDGTEVIDTVYYNITDSDIDVPDVPTKTGYSSVWQDYTLSSQDIVVYAQYTPNSYTVQFDANGGIGAMSNIDATYDQTVALNSNTFNKAGYVFAGWNSSADGSGTAYIDSCNVTNLTDTDGDVITLYAQWTATDSVYMVYYMTQNLEDGDYTLHSSIEQYGTTDSSILVAPVDIYGFITPASQSITVDAEGSSVTFYYDRQMYTITFIIDSNKSSTASVSYSLAYYSTVDVPAVVATEGYTFAGWDSDIDVATCAVSYTAQFELVEYSIEFVADDVLVDKIYYTVETVAITIPSVPDKTGYTGSWDSYQLSTQDITVTAQYTAIKYAITWVVEGVSSIDYVEYGTIPSYTTPTKDSDTQYDYTFTGWDKDIVAVVGEATYTAVFSQSSIKYTVTLDYNNSSANSTIPVEYGGKITEPADPTYDGYIFGGWYCGNELFDFDSEIVGNTYLVALWILGTEGLTYTAVEGGYAVSGMTDSISSYTSIVVPSQYNGCDVVAIDSGAFSSNTNLISVTIADSILSIGDSAFWYCTSLTTIVLSDNLVSIGSYAFMYSGLVSVTIPSTVNYIGAMAFYFCGSLSTITFESCDGWYISGVYIDVTSSATNAYNLSLNNVYAGNTWYKEQY